MIGKLMLAAQIALCLIAVYAIISARHKKHNYFAGFISSVWAGAMLATAVHGLVLWPQAVEGINLIKTLACGASAGLAWYSGGSIFKVWRLFKRVIIS